MKLRTIAVVFLLAGLTTVERVSAQDGLDKVKDLYESAAYEDALAVLTSMPEAVHTPQSEQYRAFCLIALGREEQAEEAIERLLTRNPLYVPDPAETSPRILQAFVDTRLRILPELATQTYVDAKAALDRKEREAAIAGFERVIRLVDAMATPPSTIKDIKLLASGFLDLSQALPEPVPAEPVPAKPVATPTDSSPAAAEAPKSRPVALKQTMPVWNAPDPISRRSEFTGTLRLLIGADGRVQTVELVRRVHPFYDPVLLRAAEEWLYEPARQNGVAVPAELLIEVRLRPQE